MADGDMSKRAPLAQGSAGPEIFTEGSLSRRLAEMLLDGVGDHEACLALGVSTGLGVHVRSRLRVAQGRSPYSYNRQSRRAEVRRRNAAGENDMMIAEALGVSKDSVAKDRAAMGLPASRYSRRHGGYRTTGSAHSKALAPPGEAKARAMPSPKARASGETDCAMCHHRRSGRLGKVKSAGLPRFADADSVSAAEADLTEAERHMEREADKASAAMGYLIAAARRLKAVKGAGVLETELMRLWAREVG